MKKLTLKITAVIAAVILLTAALAPTAFALGGFDIGSFSELLGGDFSDLSGLGEIIGGLLGGGSGNGEGISLGDLVLNPNGVMDILQERLANLGVEASRGEIINAIYALIGDTNPGDISSLLTSNDFINRLAEYLLANQTTEPLTELTTLPPATEENTTLAPVTTEIPSYEIPTVVIPSTYIYQGADAYSTLPAATTTEPVYSYVQPSTQYAEAATTVPFTPNYEESTRSAANNSAKLMIGAVVVLASVGAIVVVAMMLKKTKA